MWDAIGRHQFDFMVARGLAPQHFLLDVGCGSLRGGRLFIPYLEPGHYFGVDRDSELLSAGFEHELDDDARARSPRLETMEDFAFEQLDQTFDFILAQSVFTHLPLNSIMRCLENVRRVLRPGGEFYATFLENPNPRDLDPIRHGNIVTRMDRDPFHYPPHVFAALTEMTVENLGDWRHPRGGSMLRFTHG
jgi:SAM-dependent methyltransferase